MENTLSALVYGEQLIQKRQVGNRLRRYCHSGSYNPVPGAKAIFAFVLHAVLMVSCHDRSLLPTRYVQYVTDSCNGLRKTQEHTKIIFTAQYQPLDFVCLKEASGITNQGNMDQLREQFKDLVHFTFSIRSADLTKDPLHLAVYPAKYDDVLSYLDFKINKDYFITTETDTLPCLIHLYERSSTIRPEIILNLGFSQPTIASEKTHADLFLHYDDDLFGTGSNVFVFNYSDLNRLPSLKISRL